MSEPGNGAARAYRSVIDSVGVALPARTMTTREVLDGCAHRLDIPLQETTGIVSRRVAGDGEYSVDLAVRAAADCFARASIAPGDVDLLISTSISRVDGPDSFTCEPATATRLRHLLGCRDAWTFDLNNACAGQFTGIYLADALIRAGRIGTALVVSGEYISHLTRTAQLEIDNELDSRIACLTLGDAGAAVLLTRADDDRSGFDHINLRTVGRYHTLCVAGPTDRSHGGAIMTTDMVGLTAIGIREMVAHARETLVRLGRTPDQFDRFVPHQTSLLAIQAAIRRTNKIYGVPILYESNVINNLPHRGNTSTTAHMVALRDGSLDGRVRSGDRLLFGIAASGLNVGSALYRLDQLPGRLVDGTVSTRRAPVDIRRRRSLPWSRPVSATGIGLAGPVASRSATTLELIGAAATDCLRRARRRASDVELLIHAGVYRSGMIAEPPIAAIAAGELGFDGTTGSGREVLAFDLTNGALGLLDACRVAVELVHAGEMTNALVVASEVEEREPGTARPGVAACGSALFIEADPVGRSGFLGFHARHVDSSVDWFGAWAMQGTGQPYIRSGNRTGLAERYVDHIPDVVGELLDMTQVGPASVRAVVPPSLPPPLARHLQHSWSVLGQRIVALPWPGADLFTSSIPFGLRALSTSGQVAPGDLAVLVGAGSGAAIGAALYRF